MEQLLDGKLVVQLQPVAKGLGLLFVAVLGGLLIHALAFRLLRRVSRGTRTSVDDALVKHCRGPSRLIFPLLLINLVLPLLGLPAGLTKAVRHIVSLGFIAGIAWLLIRLTAVVGDTLQARYDLTASDNLQSRKVLTQLRVFRRVIGFLISLLAGASMLMTFDKVRQLGTSILASAGIVGIVVGMSAQRTLANLIAGIQLAITQPIRVDDVVIVEGEWGRIEEITFTYVVVRIWDLRRLVVPISYFIEKPFQNWTRVTADILGTVYLHLDYCVPLKELRAQLERIVQGSDKWDGKVCGIQVTNASEQTVEVRALVSASDASKAWDLRCTVREELLTFIQRKYPQALPRVRAELDRPVGTAA